MCVLTRVWSVLYAHVLRVHMHAVSLSNQPSKTNKWGSSIANCVSVYCMCLCLRLHCACALCACMCCVWMCMLPQPAVNTRFIRGSQNPQNERRESKKKMKEGRERGESICEYVHSVCYLLHATHGRERCTARVRNSDMINPALNGWVQLTRFWLHQRNKTNTMQVGKRKNTFNNYLQ